MVYAPTDIAIGVRENIRYPWLSEDTGYMYIYNLYITGITLFHCKYLNIFSHRIKIFEIWRISALAYTVSSQLSFYFEFQS